MTRTLSSVLDVSFRRDMTYETCSPRSWPENEFAVSRGEALAGEEPSGIQPSKCQCFTPALRFTTCPHWPAKNPLAFGPRNANASPSPPGSPPARMDQREALWHSAWPEKRLACAYRVRWHLKMASSEDESPSGWPGKWLLVASCWLRTASILYGARPTVVGARQ